MSNEELSEYELKRLERIAKNEAYLESIGLGSAKQKLKDMCKKTKKNAKRSRRHTIKPGQERRSKRLKKMETNFVMLSYHDDDDIAAVDQDEQRLEGESYTAQRSRSRRYASFDRSDFDLSEAEKRTLENGIIDENFLFKFKEFLLYHDKISEPNCRNVMRQVTKLANGRGIRYESPKYGWPEGCYFMPGEKVTPMSDIVQLMQDAQACEDKWGRDHGNGWLLSHPLKKLLIFQQFCLNNPDFLTAKCRISHYYALDDDDSDQEVIKLNKRTNVSQSQALQSSTDHENTKEGTDDLVTKNQNKASSKRPFPLGTIFTKTFDGFGDYEGKVVGVPDDKTSFYYAVEYEDGDEEDLTFEELSGLLENECRGSNYQK